MSKWTDAGFPNNLHFANVGNVMHALYAAIAERCDATKEYDFHFSHKNSRLLHSYIDECITNALQVFYCTDSEGNVHDCRFLTVAFEKLGIPFVTPQKFDYVLNIDWLLSRYKIINSLIFPKVIAYWNVTVENGFISTYQESKIHTYTGVGTPGYWYFSAAYLDYTRENVNYEIPISSYLDLHTMDAYGYPTTTTKFDVTADAVIEQEGKLSEFYTFNSGLQLGEKIQVKKTIATQSDTVSIPEFSRFQRPVIPLPIRDDHTSCGFRVKWLPKFSQFRPEAGVVKADATPYLQYYDPPES